MFWWPYGRGWGFWGWGRGNPYPFCRFFPWLPRGWWRFGYFPYAPWYLTPWAYPPSWVYRW